MIKFVRYTAPWCAPCRMLAPIITQIESEMNTVQFEVVDVDSSPEKAAEYNVRSVPTVILFKDDAPVKTITGAHPKKVYIDALGEIL